MRIVIDLQSCQSGSHNRGIGRYSMALTEGIIRHGTHHEIIIVLSGLFPTTIEPLKAHFEALLPHQNIRTWYAPVQLKGNLIQKNQIANITREAFLSSLNPDIILITSLFEGFADQAITSIGEFKTSVPTAVILYDLIPMLYPKTYFPNAETQAYYEQKIMYLKRANLILAISESAKQEVQIANLSISPDTISVISSAAEQHFKKVTYTALEETEIRSRFNLHQHFLMYTGGIDSRKNIQGLIQSFAQLPKSILKDHQLAIVCAIHPLERKPLLTLIQELGLTPKQVIITGFVAENDLVALYNLCKAFIFPSKHEGFGLPILEAMMCGAPVIGSNVSSIPEAIGYDDALFDPYSTEDMAKKIEKVLTDESFRHALIAHGTRQANQFSWEKTAKKALLAMENLHHLRQSVFKIIDIKRPTLAFVSPPPAKEPGIVDFNTRLLKGLEKFYEIDVIIIQPEVTDQSITQHSQIRSVKWFLKHQNHYDRVVYQCGNSADYSYQFELIRAIPGVIVLHDFYLGELLSYLERTEDSPAWSHALYYSHGYHALFARHHVQNLEYVRNHYPCNKALIDDAYGVITHSDQSLHLVKTWLNDELTHKPWFHIPDLSDSLKQTKLEVEESSAKRYFDAIEQSYKQAKHHPLQVLRALTKPSGSDQKGIFALVEALSMNQPPLAIKQLFVDISHWKRGYKYRHFEENLLRQLIHHPPTGYRVEPIFAEKTGRFYCYARTATLKWLNCPARLLHDEFISAHPLDCYISFSQARLPKKQQFFLHHLNRRGVLLYFLTHEHIQTTPSISPLDHYLNEQFPHLKWRRQFNHVKVDVN